MTTRFDTSLWWIKRDVRLADNEALTRAVELSVKVIPVYIDDSNEAHFRDWSHFHSQNIVSALSEIQEKLRASGSSILFMKGPALAALNKLHSTIPFEAVFSHEETGLDHTYKRDKRVKEWCKSHSIHWFEAPTNGVIRALRNRNSRGRIWNDRMSKPLLAEPVLPPINIPEQLQGQVYQPRPSNKDSHQIPALKRLSVVSEDRAQEVLNEFLNSRAFQYSGGISSPNSAFLAGSRLSAQLAWGTISLRTVYQATLRASASWRDIPADDATQWRKSLRAFSSRLHWRDHFIQRLESEPTMEFHALNPLYRNLEYEDDERLLAAWINGETGVPFIDACMRCLQETGFLNFRMRAMVTSYACHVLHLSWRTILYPLAKLFSDYEPGIHVSQLQMQAGVVGINTIRVYNPDKQMYDHDRDLTFTREWVPELRERSRSEIYSYKESPLANYPKPIVDYQARSKEMKSMLYAIKNSKAGREAAKEVFQQHGSRRPRRRTPDTRQLSLLGEPV